MAYYRHKKGGIYHILHEALHTETGEKLIIYQDLHNEKKIWARPKEMFFEKGRFFKISKEEALGLLNSNNKYYFPNLEYTSEMQNLLDEGEEFSKSVKSMVTLLTNKGLVCENLFDSIRNDDELEHAILERIKNYKADDNLELIYHMIQIWGGSTGRGVYVLGDGFDWNKIKPHYQKLVSRCLDIASIDEQTIGIMVDAVRDFDSSVEQMGVSFITKHTRYWFYKTLRYDSLPIYDSIMARFVMRKKSAMMLHLPEYWMVMLEKSKEYKIGLMQLERQIFKFAFHVYSKRD